ncbi:DGQHR domain-containing protein [Leucobacter sp. 1207-22]|uniref:DGQHR domain-containing protein n=1 Tax=Leucobacter sp. 1207-22 TaxID=2604456 RepID=UPI004062B9AC
MTSPTPKSKSQKKSSAAKDGQKEAAKKRRFARSIKTVFTNMGFTYVPVEGKEARFANKTGELDAVFVYENILLIVEDTTTKNVFEHAKNKKLLAEQILGSKGAFIDWLRKEFPEHETALNAYTPSRFKVFFLYIPLLDFNRGEEDLALLHPMTLVPPKALSYFEKLAKTIQHSAKTDLWRFLGLTSRDIGATNSTSDTKLIDTAIISPDESTGFSNGVRLVSFMISADVLLRNSYVLRKDNWGYSKDLYQRLIDDGRLRKIREYVATEGAAFLNNIIIGLPSGVMFQNSDKVLIPLEEAQDYGAYRMMIPDEFNSLCIIDGQHRVFAHYEGTDKLEPKVAAVRSKVHLLATGLVFPDGMSDHEKLKLQSSIFLDINSNTKPVAPDVLLAIQSLREPRADDAVARQVLERLNDMSAFKAMFQLSQMDQAPIKIASIVKFALRYLVDINSKSGLFAIWAKEDPSREKLRTEDDLSLLGNYVDYCAGVLNLYFNALKVHHNEAWADPNSKITSTTAINGMIIAFRRSLPALGVLPFDMYKQLAGEWNIDFAKGVFPYSSSQYARFSQDVLRDMFHLIEVNGEWGAAPEQTEQ